MKIFKNPYSLTKRLILFFAVLICVLLFKNKLGTYVNVKDLQESATSVWLSKIQLTKWQSELLSLEGDQKLQLATLNKSYLFTRTDSFQIFEKISLPKAIVDISFTAETYYYVDLRKEFKLTQKGNIILVTAPLLEFHRPNINFSTLKFNVKQKGFFIDEDKVMEQLKARIPLLLHDAAIKDLEVVREKARTELIEFLHNWFLKRDPSTPEMELVFSDELEV